MKQIKEVTELTRTSVFPDPMKTTRFIRGVLYGEKDREVPTEMQVWFYHETADKEPYSIQRYGLNGFDASFVAYHRRPLFRGMVNKLMQRAYKK